MISEQAQAFMDRLYEAAEHSGFLVKCTWRSDDYGFDYAMVSFRTQDQELLSGLISSAQPAITYPSSALVGLAKGNEVVIERQSYRVREVTVIGDGTETRATLALIKEEDT